MSFWPWPKPKRGTPTVPRDRWPPEAEELARKAGTEPTDENPFYRPRGAPGMYCQFDELSIVFEPELKQASLVGRWRGSAVYWRTVKNVQPEYGDCINFRGLESRLPMDLTLTMKETP